MLEKLFTLLRIIILWASKDIIKGVEDYKYIAIQEQKGKKCLQRPFSKLY